MEAEPADGFGAYLRRLRERRKLTAEALSEALYMSAPFIATWERTKCNINRRKLLHVAHALQLSAPERKKLLALADERLIQNEQWYLSRKPAVSA